MNFDFNFDFKFDDRVVADLSFYDFCLKAHYPPPFQLQEEMKDFAIYGEGIRLLLGSRGYGKTDYITILGIAFDVYQHPQREWLIITKEADRGREIVAEIRQVLTNFGVKFKNRAKTKVRLKDKLGKESNVTCLSIGSKAIRGRHPHKIAMEDPVTPDDESIAERRKVTRTYNELIKLTQDIIVIGQPVNRADLYAELRGSVETLEIPYGSIPDLDPDLEVLRMANADENDIQKSYFLKIPDDEKLKFEEMTLTRNMKKPTVCFIDPSHQGRDYTAIVFGSVWGHKIYTAGFVFRKAWDDCEDEILELCKVFKCKRLWFETNGVGKSPIKILRGMLKTIGCGVTESYTDTNKHKRIMAYATYLNDYMYYEASEIPSKYLQANKKYLAQVKNYEYNSENDDAPDASALLVEKLGFIKY